MLHTSLFFFLFLLLSALTLHIVYAAELFIISEGKLNKSAHGFLETFEMAACNGDYCQINQFLKDIISNGVCLSVVIFREAFEVEPK